MATDDPGSVENVTALHTGDNTINSNYITHIERGRGGILAER